MIYIVFYADYASDTEEYVVAVFDTEEKAKEFVKYKPNPKFYRIEIWSVQ